MQKYIKEYCAAIVRDLGPELEYPVYEFGSRLNPTWTKDQKSIATMREFFKNGLFIGADFEDGEGVDMILDLQDLSSIKTESIGAVVCFEVFEHVKYPNQAIKEIFRILKEDGILIFSVPMLIGIHGCPNDYQRYTPDGVKVLLEDFNDVRINIFGSDSFPFCTFAIAKKTSKFNKNTFAEVKKWKCSWKYPRAIDRIKYWIPQGLLNFFGKASYSL